MTDTVTIGIDASSTHCGIAVYKNGILQNVLEENFEGCFNCEKLRKITEKFEEVFSEYSPNIVLIEEPINVRNARSAMALNQVAGCIFAVATMYRAFVEYVHNRTVKKIVGFKTKEESIKAARKVIPLNYTEHEADAVNIVEAYKQIINSSQNNYYS